MLGKQGCAGKIFHAVIQRFCKCFDKRAAAGRTCFIELHAVYGLVFNFNALHILPADIEDAVHVGVKEGGGIIMSHRFHFAVIQEKGGL